MLGEASALAPVLLQRVVHRGNAVFQESYQQVGRVDLAPIVVELEKVEISAFELGNKFFSCLAVCQ